MTIEASVKWNEADVPHIIAHHNHSISDSPKKWEELTEEEIKERKRKIKNQLNETHCPKIKMSDLEKVGAKEEITKWFTSIADLVKA